MFVFNLSLILAVFLLGMFLLGVLLGVVSIPAFFVTLWGGRFTFSRLADAGSGAARVGVLMFRNLQRNVSRTALTFLAIFVLVFVVSGIWSVLEYLDKVTSAKSDDFKVIISDKNNLLSLLPPRYEQDVIRLVEGLPPGMRPENVEDNVMTWSLITTTLEPDNVGIMNSIFFFAMDPGKFTKMMDGLDEFTPEQLAEMERLIPVLQENKRAVIIGPGPFKRLGLTVGDRIKPTAINGDGLTFEFEIVGTFPEGTRYDECSLMHRDYFRDALEGFESERGYPHPMAGKSLHYIWVRLPGEAAYQELAKRVNSPGEFSSPALKVETASSAYASWFGPWQDLLWGMKWLLAPAIVMTITLVIANAISIGVPERHTEMAVLKVLGFRPWQVMALILGEAMLVGGLSGGLAGVMAWYTTQSIGGLPFGAFEKMFISDNALWWGPAIGAGTALAGSFLPAWAARSVKASQVFARVT